MNAAFAIGRLCDMDQGRKRLLQLNDSERMVCSTLTLIHNSDLIFHKLYSLSYFYFNIVSQFRYG